MLGTSACFRTSLAAQSQIVRSVRPLSSNVPAHISQAPVRRRDRWADKQGIFKQSNLMSVNRVLILKKCLDMGVIIAPKRIAILVDSTPDIAPQQLIELLNILQRMRNRDGGVLTTVLTAIARAPQLTITDAQSTWDFVQNSCVSEMSGARLALFIAIHKRTGFKADLAGLARRGLEAGTVGPELVAPVANYLMESGNITECYALINQASSYGLDRNIHIMYNVITDIARTDVRMGINLFFDLLEKDITPDYPTVSMTLYNIFTLLPIEERPAVLERIIPVLQALNHNLNNLVWDIFANYIDNKRVSDIKQLFHDWFTVLKYPIPNHAKVDHYFRKHSKIPSKALSPKDLLHEEDAEWRTSTLAFIEAYNGLRSHGFLPDHTLYIMALNAYDRLGKVSEMISILSDMTTRNCSSVQAYTIALGTMTRCNNIAEGRILYQIATSSKLTFTNSFYLSALGLAVKFDLSWARTLFRDMKNLFSIMPVKAYNLMIGALMRSSKLDEAMSILDDLLENSSTTTPTADSFFPIVMALYKKNSVKKATSYLISAQENKVLFTPIQLGYLEDEKPKVAAPPPPPPAAETPKVKEAQKASLRSSSSTTTTPSSSSSTTTSTPKSQTSSKPETITPIDQQTQQSQKQTQQYQNQHHTQQYMNAQHNPQIDQYVEYQKQYQQYLAQYHAYVNSLPPGSPVPPIQAPVQFPQYQSSSPSPSSPSPLFNHNSSTNYVSNNESNYGSQYMQHQYNNNNNQQEEQYGEYEGEYEAEYESEYDQYDQGNNNNNYNNNYNNNNNNVSQHSQHHQHAQVYHYPPSSYVNNNNNQGFQRHISNIHFSG